MATDKKSFLLYSDLIHTVKKMDKDKAGELFLTILEYVNDIEPQINDILVDLVFEPIKQQLKRDLRHWETIKDKRSVAGRASADAKRQAKEDQQSPTKSTHVDTCQQTPTHSTVSVNVNGNVNVNDIVNEKGLETPPFEKIISIPVLIDEEKKKKEKSCGQKEKNLMILAQSGINPKDPLYEITWLQLCDMPKWKKKLPISLEASLKKLKEFDEPFAIGLMQNAIEGDYQGVVFSDTKKKYLEHLEIKNNGIRNIREVNTRVSNEPGKKFGTL